MDSDISRTAAELKKQFESLTEKRDILKSPVLRELYGKIKDIPAEDRPAFGQKLNELKEQVQSWVDGYEAALESASVTPIDLTAPFDVNIAPADRPGFLPAEHGSRHPLSTERQVVANIFARMGYDVLDSRQL